MNIIVFSFDNNVIDNFEKKLFNYNLIFIYDLISLISKASELQDYIIISDYDTLSKEVNQLLKENILPEKFIVLEKIPNIITGRKLIYEGIKAYGNTNMSKIHLTQMIEVVSKNKIWTYPELTNNLQTNKNKNISETGVELINNKLNEIEKKVVFSILKGMNNKGIEKNLNITSRQVKTYMSSILKKLHVLDKLSLVLLLKS